MSRGFINGYDRAQLDISSAKTTLPRSMRGVRGIDGRKRSITDRLDLRVPDRLLLMATVLMGFSLPRLLPDVDAAGGSPISQIVWTCVYLLAIVGIVVERKTAMRLVRGSLPVVLIVLFAVCSTVWSEAPLETAKESLGLVGTSLLALYFVSRLSLRTFVETLGMTLIITAAASALLVAFFPAFGRMQDDSSGLWQGSYVHKNILGMAMVLAMVTLACRWDRLHGLPRKFAVAAFLMCTVLLAGSRASTSFIAAVALAVIIPLLLWSRAIRSVKPILIIVAVSFVAIVGAITFGFGADELLGLFGKDATLTGRTELWQYVLKAIGERPIFGYGFDAFFNSATSTGQDASRVLGWDVNMAHDGFLEVTLAIGLVGLSAVVLMFVIGTKRAATLFWRERDLTSFWPLLIMFYTLLTNITEAGIARVNDVRWIVFLAAFLYATDAHQRRKRLAHETPFQSALPAPETSTST